MHLDRGGAQEPLHLAHAELDQPVPLGVVGPRLRGELERARRPAETVVVGPQPDHAHVLVEPVRVAHEELAQAGQGARLEALGHVALQTGPVGRRQVRVRLLVREAAQPAEQVLAGAVGARRAVARRRRPGRGRVLRRERHRLARGRRGRRAVRRERERLARGRRGRSQQQRHGQRARRRAVTARRRRRRRLGHLADARRCTRVRMRLRVSESEKRSRKTKRNRTHVTFE